MNLAQQQTESLKVVDAEYSVESGHKVPQPVIHLFCRDGDRNYRQIDVEGFRPYFMLSYDEFVDRTSDVLNDRHVLSVEADLSAVEWDEDGNLSHGSTDEPESVAETLTATANETHVVHEPETFDALDDTKLVKVFTVEPKHVGKIRDHWEQTWEADVPFARRFLISSGIHLGVEVPTGATRVRYENWNGHSDSDTHVQEISACDPPEVKPRMLVVDIEVRTNGGGVPDPANADNQITAITTYDNYEDEYAGWILTSDQWEQDYDEETFHQDVHDELDIDLDAMRVFDHETKMVEDFHEWVLARNFDIMSGWNSNGFDAPYIIQRSYNISAYSIRDWDMGDSPFNAGDEWPEPVVDGLVLFDMLDAYKKTQYRDLRSYKLEDVSQAELGMGKIQLEESLDDAWHKQPVEFMRYNVRDVEAVVEIERESALLDLYDNMRQVTGALYNTCNHNGPMLDTLFLRQAYDSGIALTTNYEPEQGDYHGAWVADPVPGKHDTVVYPDLASLYPFILWTLNISPETMYTSKAEYRDAGYTDDQMFTAYIDKREWYTMSSGDSIELSEIDESTYKGVHDETGSRKKKGSQDFDGIFDPEFHEIYFVKPSVEEGFIRQTVDLLVDLKYRYKGQGDMYSAVKRVTNCHTPDTTVLTPNGRVPIADITVGDKVYSFDTEERRVEVETVTNTFDYEHDGEIVDISTPHFKASVTPDHEFPLSMQYSDELTDVPAKQISDTASARYAPSVWSYESDSSLDTVKLGEYVNCTVHLDSECHGNVINERFGDDSTYEGSGRQTHIISEGCVESEYDEITEYGTLYASDGSEYARVPFEYDAENFVKLMGWYIAEGNCIENNTGSRTVRITQTDDKNRECITSLLDTMDISYSVSTEKTINISSAVLNEFFSTYCGSGSEHKKIPDFIFNKASVTEMECLFESMMAGDGHRSESSQYYATKSEGLAKDVSHLLVLIGHAPKISEVDIDEYGTSYRIMWRTSDTVIRNTSCSVREYTGKVHDIEVGDNHTYLFEKDNVTSVSHNSVYGVLGDSASGGKGFRLFDWKLAEAITLGGQKVINYTADQYIRLINEYSEEAGFEPNSYLVGGDTDSVMTAIPQAPDYGTALEWAQRASEEFQPDEETGDPGLYDEFMEDEFGVVFGEDEHKMDVEIESLGSSLFFMQDGDNEDKAVKKRYAQHMIWDEDDGWLHDDLQTRNNVSLADYEQGGILSADDATDNIGIKGFEYVRSDSATVTKEAQLNVLTYILLADDTSDRIYSYLSDLNDSIYDDDFDVAKLGRPKGISNPLDEYGWKSVDELENDTNYTVNERDEERGGRYVSTPSPSYRGAKYADDHIPWEDIGEGAKPVRFYVDKVRGDKFPPAYEYDDYPKDEQRGDPPEVGRNVDAIAVEDPDRIPREFVLDKDTMVEKELKDKIQPILRTIGEDWDGLVGEGRQTGLDSWM